MQKYVCDIFRFFSVIIRTVSRRVFFFLRNKFQRTNIFIVIQFKISPRVFSKLILENQRSFVLGIYEEKKDNVPEFLI